MAWKRCASTRWAWPRSKVGVTNRRCGRGHARCGRGHQSVGVAVGGAKVLIGVRWAGLEGGSSPLAPHGISGGSIGGSLEWGGGTPKVGGCPPYCCHQALEALPKQIKINQYKETQGGVLLPDSSYNAVGLLQNIY